MGGIIGLYSSQPITLFAVDAEEHLIFAVSYKALPQPIIAYFQWPREQNL